MATNDPKAPSTPKRRVKKVVKKKAATSKAKAKLIAPELESSPAEPTAAKPPAAKETAAKETAAKETAAKETAAKETATKPPAKKVTGRKPSVSVPPRSAPLAGRTSTEPREPAFRAPRAPSAPTTSYHGGSVRGTDVTNFLRQLIMLIEAGTPILKSLKTLSNRGHSANARALVADIATYVESGNPLWQSFDRHPRYFDSVFVNLIKASEASGTLVIVLRRVVEYRIVRELMRKRVIGAMVYPVLLVTVCYAVTYFIAAWVVPGFRDMFSSGKIEVPGITSKIFVLSNYIVEWWWLPIVAVIGLIVVYKGWFVRNPLRRLAADRIKLKVPILGPIFHKNAIVELTRTMALLLRSGVSMMATLDLVRSAVHNRAVAESLQGVRDSVERGGGLEPPLRAAEGVIPAVVTDMLVTGEESGRVDIVADQVADVYEEEVKIAVMTVGETLLPVFAILVGVVVLIIAIGLFLPILSSIDQLSGM